MLNYKYLTRKYPCLKNYNIVQMCRKDHHELFAEPVNPNMVSCLSLI